MEIRQLVDKDMPQFRDLIVNMYSNLENLEWFSPMPYDEENVLGMINHPRFYIVGAFEGEKLVGVSSLDYKCGKLIGKVDFPAECDTTSLVEMAFNMVHSDYRGRGIMKAMINHLLDKIVADGFKWAFSKVHKDNFASSKSLEHNGFKIFADYKKGVDMVDFVSLSSADFFSPKGKENARVTLSKYSPDDEKIIVDYNLLIKKL